VGGGENGGGGVWWRKNIFVCLCCLLLVRSLKFVYLCAALYRLMGGGGVELREQGDILLPIKLKLKRGRLRLLNKTITQSHPSGGLLTLPDTKGVKTHFFDSNAASLSFNFVA